MIGQRISNFQLNQKLGSGGMGTVYKAKDLKLNRNVAVKMLHPHITNKSNAYKRFKNEAQISAQINHPNVTTLYDFIAEQGRSYIIMEYVNGKTIEDLLKQKGKFNETECISIAIQMLKGLGEAHRLNILHRDLKPGNIMINQNGFTKLMDFGIARIDNTTRLTAQNKVIGTAEYIAPEIYQGKAPSKVSDLYAIGVILYEMITGKTLFKADSEATLIYKVVNGKPDFDFDGVNTGLAQVIKKLIQKNPKKRFRSAEETIDTLNSIQVKDKAGLNLSTKLATQIKSIKLPELKSIPLPKNIGSFHKESSLASKFLFGSVVISLVLIFGSFFFKSESDLSENPKDKTEVEGSQNNDESTSASLSFHDHSTS
ncbi:MAG: serine/threonine-protein kinase, partial [Bacteroidota bacterium]